MMHLHPDVLSTPLPVSSNADLVKHAVDVVRLRTPLLPSPLTPQFKRSHHSHLPVLLVIPSTPPHPLWYQATGHHKYAANAVRATTPLLPPPFLDPAVVLPTATASTSSSPSPPTLTSAGIRLAVLCSSSVSAHLLNKKCNMLHTSRFSTCCQKGKVHDSDPKMGEHGKCKNLQGVVSRLLLHG